MAPDELFDLIEVAFDEVGKIAENLGNLLESVSEFCRTWNRCDLGYTILSHSIKKH